MLDCIRTLSDVPENHGVRIVRDDLQAEQQRKAVLEKARLQAQAYVDEAHVEAEQLRVLGYRHGYAEGMQRICIDLANLLLEQRRLTRQLYDDLEAAACRLLSGLLHRHELVDEIVGHWLADRDVGASDHLHMVLPEYLHHAEPELLARIRQRWSNEGGDERKLHLEWHTGERFLLRLGDQVLEFDPQATEACLTPQVMSKVERLPDAARQLDTLTRSRLRQFAEALATSSDDQGGNNDQEEQHHD